jgi:hypothetical protein
MALSPNEIASRSRVFALGTEAGRLAEASRRARQHQSTFSETMNQLSEPGDKSRLSHMIYDYMHADTYGRDSATMIQDVMEMLSDQPLKGLTVQDSHMAVLTGIQAYISNAALDNNGSFSEERHESMVLKRLNPAIRAADLQWSGGLSIDRFTSEHLSNSAAYANNVGRTVDNEGELIAGQQASVTPSHQKAPVIDAMLAVAASMSKAKLSAHLGGGQQDAGHSSAPDYSREMTGPGM